MSGTLQLIQLDSTVPATLVGRVGVSTDGLGTNTTGTLQAQIPAGSTIEYAVLHVATRSSPLNPFQPASIKFEDALVPITYLSNVGDSTDENFETGRADVTSIVANKVGGGSGIFDFLVDETVTISPELIEGTSLTVIYSNPNLPERTIAILEGGVTGPTVQTTTFSLATPIDKSDPNFIAQMSLGIQFGFGTNVSGQYSVVDINGSRLTSSAGSADDSNQLNPFNGNLITVGGVGNSLANPTNTISNDLSLDDELYDLAPFLATGDTTIQLDTSNPSDDDSIFLVVLTLPGIASVTPTPTSQADIQVTKTDGLDAVTPGSSITYTITVTNLSQQFDVQNIQVSDPLSEVITGATWSATLTGGGSFPTPADQTGTGSINTKVNLNAGASVTYTIQAIVSPSVVPGTILSNGVTVTPPPEVNDPVPSNNISIDQTSIIAPPTPTPTPTPIPTPTPEKCQPGLVLSGNNRNNQIQGDKNSDRLFGRQGNDKIKGLECHDELFGNRGNDILMGNAGQDRIKGGQERDRLLGGEGDDELRGGLGFDRLRGQEGDDTLQGFRGDDRIGGAVGNDVIDAGRDQDRVHSGKGEDFVRGRRGDDIVSGGAGHDSVLGGVGADLLRGRSGEDRMRGQRGNDTLVGGRDRDTLMGDLNEDVLKGHRGNDALAGGNDADQIYGERGQDSLIGGLGQDTLIGGQGADRFIYTKITERQDTILDFGQGDRLDFQLIFERPQFSSTNIFASYIRVQSVGAGTIIQLDTNGDRSGRRFRTMVTLAGVDATSITAASFA